MKNLENKIRNLSKELKKLEEKRTIQKYEQRIKELEYLKNNSLLLEFLTENEINMIITDYENIVYYTEFGEC